MLILGIDPGIATTGYGFIEYTKKDIMAGNKVTLVDSGCIVTPAGMIMPQRLSQLHKELRNLIKSITPDAIAIENLFFFSNAKTVISVGQARGVVMLVAGQLKIPVFEYAPLQVKLAIVGYGRAKKKQVEKHVVKHLGVKKLKLKEGKKVSDGHHIDDIADALAVAICHVLKTTEYKK